ncbi:MAG: hypothetical protein Q8J78_03475, partial [Moraxellaceae bacterium]|nr:hypothetical protein [Moraxellaceae bacterium]
FMTLKRHGRIIDVIWFQHSPEYARSIMEAADAIDDAALKEVLASVRESFADHLAPATVTVLSVVTPAPSDVQASTAVDTPDAGEGAGQDDMPVLNIPIPQIDPRRYIGGLR